jgi:hypothetical protein
MPPETKTEDLETVNTTAGEVNYTANTIGNDQSPDLPSVATELDRSSLNDGMAHYPITPPYDLEALVRRTRPHPSEIGDLPPNTILPVYRVFSEQTSKHTEMRQEVIGQFVTLKLANECVLWNLEKRSDIVKPEDSVCGVNKEGMIWWAWQNRVSTLDDKEDG